LVLKEQFKMLRKTGGGIGERRDSILRVLGVVFS